MASILPPPPAPPGSSPVEESKEARKERRRREKERLVFAALPSDGSQSDLPRFVRRLKEEEAKAAAKEQHVEHAVATSNGQSHAHQSPSAASEQFLAAIGQSMLQTLFQQLVQAPHALHGHPAPAHPHSPPDRLSTRHLTEAPTASSATPIRKSSAAIKLETVPPSLFPTTAEVGVLRDQLAVKTFLLAQEERRTAALQAEKDALAKELATLKEEMEGKIKKAKKAVKEIEESARKPVLVLATCAPSQMNGALKGLSTQELRVIKTQFKAALAAASKAKKDAKRREQASARLSASSGAGTSGWLLSSLVGRPVGMGPVVTTPLVSSSQRSLQGVPPPSPSHAGGVSSQLGGQA